MSVEVVFNYAFEPILFRIEQHTRGYLSFLTSLFAIVGGVFTVTIFNILST